MNLSQQDAILLEHLVRKVYKLNDRGYLGGLIDADHLRRKPFDAAIISLSALFQKDTTDAVTEFISEYETVFDYPNENQDYTFDMYYNALRQLVHKLIKQ